MLGSGQAGVTIEIDYNDDGTVDQTIITGTELSDALPPSTTATLNGTQTPTGYLPGATVTLAAADNEGGTGVAATEYSLDDGATPWKTYSEPLVFDEEGEITLLYRSRDALGNTEDDQSLAFTIYVNHAPTLSSIGNRTVDEGQELAFTVAATDPDTADTLALTATNIPEGASFDPASGIFTWIPTFEQAGSYPGLTFTVTDSGTPPLSANEAITITVDDVDNLLPVTTATVSGTEGSNGWYTSDATVTLTAEDNAGGSGIQTTKYSLDSGSTWTPYTAPLSFTQEGETGLQFFSADNTGNAEVSRVLTIKIDKAAPAVPVPPAVTATATTSITLAWPAAADATSGTASYTILRNNLPVGTTADLTFTDTELTPGTAYAYQLTATDLAGNTSAASAIRSASTQAVPMSIAFTSSVTSVNGVTSATLAWDATGFTSCTASGGWSGPQAVSGTLTVSPATETTYTLTCTAGSATAQSTVTVAAPSPTPAPNLIHNPGFEATGSWSTGFFSTSQGTISRTTSTKHSGSYSYVIDGSTSSSSGQVYTDPAHAISVTPGKRYTYKAWYKGNNAYLVVKWYGAGGTEIIAAQQGFDLEPTSAWLQTTERATAPAGAATARVFVQARDTSAPVWFDDLEFFEDIASLPTSLTNPGFEAQEGWFTGFWTTSKGTASRTTLTKHSGNYAYMIDGDTSASGGQVYGDPANQLAVTPGGNYTYKAWYKGSNAWLVIKWLDASGNELTAARNNFSLTNTTVWTQATKQATAPAGAAKAWMFVQSRDNASPVYFDDLEFSEL